MSGIGQAIAVLLRNEHLMARRRLTVARNQVVLLIFAALAGGLALVMLNLAAFFGLRAVMAPYWAALIVAGADMAIGLVIAWIATHRTADEEAEQAAEIRDAAIARIEAELDAALSEVRDLKDSVHRIARNPLGTLAPTLLAPLIARLLGTSKTEDTPEDGTQAEDDQADSQPDNQDTDGTGV